MSKNGEAEFWKQKLNKVQDQLTLEIKRGNVLQILGLMSRQRQVGCKVTGDECGDACSCKDILNQDINSVMKLRGF